MTEEAELESSAEQLYFLAYAQSWCSIATPQIEQRLLMIDSHSPPKHRVNLPLSHFPGFWETFTCSQGTPMHVANACEVLLQVEPPPIHPVIADIGTFFRL